jgi:hypothetical protein
VLFAIAFGYVEAAVVAYLRSIDAPLRAHFYPALPASELFPLLSLAFATPTRRRKIGSSQLA